MSQQVIKKRKKSIYIVWIIPIVSMILALWMINKYYSEKGQEIVVTFKSGTGFVVDKTALMYKGVRVGRVNSIYADPDDLSKINVTIMVDSSAYPYIARSHTKFIKVEPKISLTKIEGLGTILSGSYIEVITDATNIDEMKNFPYQFKFNALDKRPKVKINSDDYIKLSAQQADISDGSAILYNKIVVGTVVDHYLSSDGVEYIVQIDKNYIHLVRNNTYFYKLSAIEFQASLAGINMKIDSLATLITGGISFDTPSHNGAVDDLEPREKDKSYKLYNSKDDALLDSNIITLVGEKGYKMHPAQTHIYYKGIEAGNVVDITYFPKKDETHFKIRFKPYFKELIIEGAYFWIVEPKLGLDEIKGLDAIVRGNYITFEKDKNEKVNDYFKLHTEEPKKMGKYFTLKSEDAKSLKEGVLVFYHDIEVGFVDSVNLDKDNKHVNIKISINEKYISLVNDSTIFYMQNALESEVNFDGISVSVPSIKGMLSGGITFKTIDFKVKSSKNNFLLHHDKKLLNEQEYLNSDGLFITLTSATLGSIKKGSPIYFKQMKVGKIVAYSYYDKEFIIKAFIEKSYKSFVNDSTVFFNSSGVSLKMNFPNMEIKTESLQTILSGGISFITKNEISLKHKFDNSKFFQLYASYAQSEVNTTQISIMMKEKNDIKIGSQITYKSMTIGKVTDLFLDVNSNIKVTAQIEKKYMKYFVTDSRLWVDNFSLNLSGVKNSAAIISGAFIAILPGNSEEQQNHFIIQQTKPAASLNKRGLRLVLEASKMSSLKVNSPLYYRQFIIGNVEELELKPDASAIDILVYIEPCFEHLVQNGSKFYHAGGIGMNFDLSGLKIKTETMSTIVSGGVILVTPDIKSKQGQEMQVYKLYNKPEVNWIEWAPKLISTNSMCK